MSCVVSIYLNCRYNVYSNAVCLFRSSGGFWCFSFLARLFRLYFMCKSKEIYWAGFSKFKVYTKKVNVFKGKKMVFYFSWQDMWGFFTPQNVKLETKITFFLSVWQEYEHLARCKRPLDGTVQENMNKILTVRSIVK